MHYPHLPSLNCKDKDKAILCLAGAVTTLAAVILVKTLMMACKKKHAHEHAHHEYESHIG